MIPSTRPWYSWSHNMLNRLRTQQFVTLKILTADTEPEKAARERDALLQLRNADPLHAGHNHVVQLLDSFYHKGPNGQHMCLAYKPMGENILRSQARMPSQKMPLSIVKSITRQLLHALDLIHSHGWTHTGELYFCRMSRVLCCL